MKKWKIVVTWRKYTEWNSMILTEDPVRIVVQAVDE